MSEVPRRAVFSDRSRSDPSPRRHNERLYAFLDRVAGPWFDGVRTLLQDWLDSSPEGFASRVAREFRTRRDRQLYAAFWELYQFALWSRIGFEVEPEPAVWGSSRLADLLVKGDLGEALIEATVSFDEETDSPASRRQGDAYAALDRTNSPNFFIWIEVEQGEGPMPSLARVRQELETWLQGLDPDLVATALENSAPSRRRLPSLQLAAGSWTLRFDAIPKRLMREARPAFAPSGSSVRVGRGSSIQWNVFARPS